MQRYVILGVVIVVVGLPLTLLSLREFQDDPTLPLDVLNRSVTGALKKSPGVVRVDVARILRPTHRIVHLRDRPFLSQELFARRLKATTDHVPADEELARRYREYLAAVDALQEEQMELVRAMVKQHGLKRIHAEGLSAADLPAYREKISSLKALSAHQIVKLRSQLQDVQQSLAENPSPKVKSIETTIQGMLADFQMHLLEMGAAGRLLIRGEIEDVLPMEDKTSDNRDDAIVKCVLKDGPFSFLILDGEHDLTDNVKRLGGGKCEYIQVTTTRYQDLDGK